jgi:hypothetical protein
MAGKGTEQTRSHLGKPGAASSCDADCDAFSADRIELLTRAVILVAGMNLAEAERAPVLERVIADLASPTTRIPEWSSRAGEGLRSFPLQVEIRSPDA